MIIVFLSQFCITLFPRLQSIIEQSSIILYFKDLIITNSCSILVKEKLQVLTENNKNTKKTISIYVYSPLNLIPRIYYNKLSGTEALYIT